MLISDYHQFVRCHYLQSCCERFVALRQHDQCIGLGNNLSDVAVLANIPTVLKPERFIIYIYRPILKIHPLSYPFFKSEDSLFAILLCMSGLLSVNLLVSVLKLKKNFTSSYNVWLCNHTVTPYWKIQTARQTLCEDDTPTVYETRNPINIKRLFVKVQIWFLLSQQASMDRTQ